MRFSKSILIIAVVVTALVFATGCEKISSNDEVVSNQVENGTKMRPLFDYYEIGGVKYAWDPFNGVEVVGYYMRMFIHIQIGSFINFATCCKPEGNCLPDAGFTSGPSPIIEDINSFDPNNIEYFDITEEMCKLVDINYGKPLKQAIKDGNEAIKKFILNNFSAKINLPENMLTDFKNDKLTVKEFNGKYFIVNRNATNYLDTPDYFSQK